jgi:hypothetical protein
MPSPTCRVSPLCESSPAARPATDLQQPTESPGSPARRSPRSAIEIDVLMGHRTRGAQTARTHARCQVQGAHHSQQAELRVRAPQASPVWLPDCSQGVTHHTEVLFWLSGKGDASVWPGEPRKAHKTDRHTAVAVAHRSDTRAAMSSRAVRELEKQLMNLTVSATRSTPPPPHKHTSVPQSHPQPSHSKHSTTLPLSPDGDHAPVHPYSLGPVSSRLPRVWLVRTCISFSRFCVGWLATG